MDTPAVEMKAVRKSFGKVEVLRGVDFDLRRGEVHALLGGNGAGKSTLMKILGGVHRPDGGTVTVGGVPADFRSPAAASAAGIGMVFQEFSLVPTLTVAQNVFLGREPRRFGLIDDTALNRRTAEILHRMGTRLDPRAPVGELPVGHWQLTEIAKALSLDATVLIMDEPTARLSHSEIGPLFDLVRRLTGQGVSVVYISHRMAEIAQIADRMSVLREGQRVLSGGVTEIPPEQVAEAIVGREIHGGLGRRTCAVRPGTRPVLSVRNLRAGSRVAGVSFDVAPGEILGVAGLIGSGRTELTRCLFGIDRIEAGEIQLGGKPYRPRGPAEAIRAGMLLVPEDRQLEGLVLDHAVYDNALLPSLSRIRRGPFLGDRRGAAVCQSLISSLGIRGATRTTPVRHLSGGNQQKVVLAKWLALKENGLVPKVLVLDEPTAGIDIGAKTEILRLTAELAAEGTAVVIVSSELEELLAVADRVVVLRSGAVHADLARDDIEDEESLQLVIQGA
ncbi:sugar ABC transporter ATP-binding protein [Amycolatopsis jejuensis]|uniref:sugar ABC transporter ATP-binding protein n=1 Tax=Amycolatopsis jejuensis TaxID=330084 RepID=UPI000525947C|nr:sugar ABC transporter ATP-binding protein [Amycolatopsis jejuensis]